MNRAKNFWLFSFIWGGLFPGFGTNRCTVICILCVTSTIHWSNIIDDLGRAGWRQKRDNYCYVSKLPKRLMCSRVNTARANSPAVTHDGSVATDDKLEIAEGSSPVRVESATNRLGLIARRRCQYALSVKAAQATLAQTTRLPTCF